MVVEFLSSNRKHPSRSRSLQFPLSLTLEALTRRLRTILDKIDVKFRPSSPPTNQGWRVLAFARFHRGGGGGGGMGGFGVPLYSVEDPGAVGNRLTLPSL